MRVKIYCKKEVLRESNTKNNFIKPKAQGVFVTMNEVIQVLAPTVGYFAGMDLKPKVKSF